MAPSLLDQIVETKRRELEAEQAALPLAAVRRAAQSAPPPRNFFAAVTAPGRLHLIAEIKKASPSAGLLVPTFDPVTIARLYEQAGASALSVLTDWTWFQGRLEHIAQVREACALPVLRKDFTLDSYHVYQARAALADAVLLIAEILSDETLVELATLAGDLGMTVLLEAHHAARLAVVAGLVPRLRAKVLLGINNRDLARQRTDIQTTVHLGPTLKGIAPFVSESGIQTREDVLAVEKAGASAILVGESLLRSADIAGQIRALLNGLRRPEGG